MAAQQDPTLSNSNFSQPPPIYEAPTTNPYSDEPLFSDRNPEDEVPDDFKYSTSVSQCELSIRHAFIRRVYTLLFFQLALTVAVGSIISYFPTIREWSITHPWALFASLFGSLAFMICSLVWRKSYPNNLIFLGLFTLSESYALGVISSLSDTLIVLEAVLLTAIIFAGMSLFAFQTKYDLTGLYGYLFGALCGLLGVGFVSLIIPFSSGMELIYSIGGAVIFSLYIMVDTQMIMNKYHPEEEIAATISLYLDIINLFLYILRILQSVQDN